MTASVSAMDLPAALTDPIAFCALLRDRHRFVLGVDEVDRLTRLLVIAHQQSLPMDTAEQVHRIISPVLARTPQEQVVLLNELQLAFDPAIRAALEHEDRTRRQIDAATERTPREEVVVTQTETLSKLSFVWLVPLFALAVAAYVAYVEFTQQPVSPVEPGPVIVQPDTGPGLLSQLFSLLFSGQSMIYGGGVIAVCVAAVWFYANLRQMWASRDKVAVGLEQRPLGLRPGGRVFFATESARQLVRRMVRHVDVESTRLNPPATLRATVAAGNQLRQVFRLRKRQPEFLVLFDRAGVDDLMQIGCADLVATMRAQSVHVERFDYVLDPARAISVDASGQTGWRARFSDLLSLSEDRQVLLFADPRQLHIPGQPDVPQPWVADLTRQCSVLTLVSPVPLARLGTVGQTLARRLGIQMTSLLQLSLGRQADTSQLVHYGQEPSLLDADRLSSDAPPTPSLLEPMRRWMLLNLSPGARECLAALSFYPQITPDLTRSLSETLRDGRGGRLMTGPHLAEIAGLSWLRHAQMPDWAREFVQLLVPERRRLALSDQVTRALSPDALATGALTVAVDRNPRMLDWLARLRGGPTHDAVVARGHRNGPLAFLLPGNLLRGAGVAPLDILMIVLGVAIGLAATRTMQGVGNGDGLFMIWFLLVTAGLFAVTLAVHDTPESSGRLLKISAWVWAGFALSVPIGEFFFVQLGAEAGLWPILAMGTGFVLRGPNIQSASAPARLQGTNWATLLMVLVGITMGGVYCLSTGSSIYGGYPVLFAGVIAVVVIPWLGLPLIQIPIFAALVGGTFYTTFIAVELASFALLGDANVNLTDPGSVDWLGGVLTLPVAGLLSAIPIFLAWTTSLAAAFVFLDRKGVLVTNSTELGWFYVFMPLILAVFLSLLLLLPYVVGANFDTGRIAGLSLVLIALPLAVPCLLIAFLSIDAILMLPKRDFYVGLGWYLSALIVVAALASLQAPAIWIDLLGLISLPLTVLTVTYVYRDEIGIPLWHALQRYTWSDSTPDRTACIVSGFWCATVFSFQFGVSLGATTIGLDLTFLAYPFAVWIGATQGRMGFQALAIGSLPFLAAFSGDFGPVSLRSAQSIPAYFACLLLARFGAMESLRHDIYRVARLTQWQTVFLTLGFLFGGSVFISPDVGILFKTLDYLWAIFFLLGMSNVPLRSFLRPLLVVWMLSFMVSYLGRDPIEALSPFANLNPALGGLMSLPNLLVVFFAGRILRDFVRDPTRQPYRLNPLVLMLVGLVLLSIPRLTLELSTLPPLGLRLNLYMGIVLLYAALGFVAGRIGVVMALGVDVIFYGILPTALSFSGIHDAELLLGALRINTGSPAMVLGVEMTFGQIGLSFGGTLSALIGGWMRLILCDRLGQSAPDLSEVLSNTEDEALAAFRGIESAMSEGKKEVETQIDQSRNRAKAARFGLINFMPSLWSGLSLSSAKAEADREALNAQPEFMPEGHPALRALWMDRFAVMLGIATLAWLPIYILLSLDFPGLAQTQTLPILPQEGGAEQIGDVPEWEAQKQ